MNSFRFAHVVSSVEALARARSSCRLVRSRRARAEVPGARQRSQCCWKRAANSRSARSERSTWHTYAFEFGTCEWASALCRWAPGRRVGAEETSASLCLPCDKDERDSVELDDDDDAKPSSSSSSSAVDTLSASFNGCDCCCCCWRSRTFGGLWDTVLRMGSRGVDLDLRKVSEGLSATDRSASPQWVTRGSAKAAHKWDEAGVEVGVQLQLEEGIETARTALREQLTRPSASGTEKGGQSRRCCSKSAPAWQRRASDSASASASDGLQSDAELSRLTYAKKLQRKRA